MKNTDRHKSMKWIILFRFGIITLVLAVTGGVFMLSNGKIREAQSLVTDYTGEKMLLQKAASDHWQWAIQLLSAITFEEDFTGSTDPKSCEFGSFLYSSHVQNSPEWKEFIQNIQTPHEKLHQESTLILSQDDPARARELYQNNIVPLLDSLRATFNSNIDEHSARVQDIEQAALRMTGFQTAVIAIQILILLLLLANTYFFIRREVIKPILHIREECGRLARGQLSLDFNVACKNIDIRQLSDALKLSIAEIKRYIDDIDRAMSEIANGNFNVAPSQPFIGDFKAIEDSIRKMIIHMSQTLRQMDTAASQVSDSSSLVSDVAQALAQGAGQQASSIQELAEAITEISGQIRQNADNSGKASQMANGATAAISANNEQMHQLMVSMHDISAKSSEISNIIKTIEDIAFQTNIVALNAAIEAARAGMAGKGFAVVAEEIRDLAANSAKAAQNITSLISSSVTAISDSVDVAQATADNLLQVVEGANDTTAVILEIAKATKAQSQAVSQITLGLDQLSGVVQQNSATSQESAAASQELSGQAQLLQSLVGQFQLKA